MAQESCGLKVGRLIADGKTKELAALFANPAKVVNSLLRVTGSLGKVTDIQLVSTPRFEKFTRISVRSTDLPTSEKYEGYWINAHSRALGPLQFHVARKLETDCEILALHVDTAQNAAVPAQ
jgi:hypothetical protein